MGLYTPKLRIISKLMFYFSLTSTGLVIAFAYIQFWSTSHLQVHSFEIKHFISNSSQQDKSDGNSNTLDKEDDISSKLDKEDGYFNTGNKENDYSNTQNKEDDYSNTQNKDDYSNTRNKEDGSFIDASNHYGHIYMYSAFWDDRWSVTPSIRIITLLETNSTRTQDLNVYIFRLNGSLVLHHNIRTNTLKSIRHNFMLKIGHLDILFGRYVVSVHINETVSFSSDLRLSLAFHETVNKPEYFLKQYVPVERPIKPDGFSYKMFGTCFSVGYGDLDHNRIVEWIEIQRIIGVDQIIVYNGSIGQQASLALRHYEGEGFVRIHQIHPIFSTAIDDIMLRQVIGINDCLYRYMYTFKHMMFLDTDEVIVPRKHSSLYGMIQIQSNRAAYAFYAANFIINPDLNARPDEGMPVYTHTLRYRWRRPIFNVGTHRKLLIDPMGCVKMFMHNCPTYADKFPHRTTVLVNSAVALTHHYRDENCSQTDCTQWINDSSYQPDHSMVRFAPQLIANVERHLEEIHKHPVFQSSHLSYQTF